MNADHATFNAEHAGVSTLPRLVNLDYQLRYHRIGEWSLERWLVTATWGLALILLVQWLVAERPPLTGWHWFALVLLIISGALILTAGSRAAHRAYLVFEPEPEVAPPAGQALLPADKVLHHAAGRFEVESKSQFFAGLLAYWRTFTTREHAVMAIVHYTRFLGLGRMRASDVGMWYAFFRPEVVEEVAPGQVAFGAAPCPGLRVTYRLTPPAREGKRPPRPVQEILYLWFEDDETRRRVWADLLADAAH